MAKPHLALSGLAAWVACSSALADAPVKVDIDSQPIDSALNVWAGQTGYQVLVAANRATSAPATSVKGSYTPEAALKVLLASTGLKYDFVNRRTVTIRAADAEPSSSAEPGTPATKGIQEVVVTANRREERIGDIAGGIQAFSGEVLDANGAKGFEDYLLQVPGASFRSQGNGANRIALRGIGNLIGSDFGTTSTVSTVGLYLNDVPIQGTSVLPDLALYDLARIEVLSGPQGTLYGEGAMGGAVRMILQPPNTERMEGKTDVSISNFRDGGMNYGFRGMLNVPLNDSVAARLVGSYQDDSGFIDNLNPVVAKRDYNGSTHYSVRGTLLANVTERFSVEVLGLRDDLKMDGPNYVMFGLDDLSVNQSNARQPQFNDSAATVLGATLRYQLPFAELTSVTSNYSTDRDFVVPFPVSSRAAPVIADDSMLVSVDLDSFSQEVRLVSTGENRFDWIAGAFYRDRETNQIFDQTLLPSDFLAANTSLAAAGRPTFAYPLAYHEIGKETYRQKAVYGEGGIRLTDRWKFTAGLRWYDEERSYDPAIVFGGPFAAFSVDAAKQHVDDDGVVPKFQLTYKFAEDRLVYGLASKGFRTSVINVQYRTDGLGLGDPSADSDSLWNYEIGAKTRWLDDRFMLNGTIFHADWSKLQLPLIGTSPLTGAPAGYIGNGGKAELRGATLESAFVVNERLSAGMSVGYTHSEVTEGADVGVTVGVELPNTPEWTASAQTEYRMPLASGGEGFVRLVVNYVDDQTTRVLTRTETNPQPLSAYTMGNLRFGADFGRWGLSMFVDNIWDERAELGRGVVAAALRNPDLFSISRPRTIGVMMNAKF